MLSPQKPNSQPPTPLRTHVEHTVRQFFDELEGDLPHNLYQTILREIEKPLLTVVLEKAAGNQTKAADILGINRGTLRKKMSEHQLL